MQHVQNVTDRQFVELFDLAGATMGRAREHYDRREYDLASRAILEAIDATDLRTYVSLSEALALGREVAADFPDTITHFEQLCTMAEGLADRPAESQFSSAERFQELHGLLLEARTWTRRGRGMVILAQLYSMTGDTKWADKAGELLADLPVFEAEADHQADTFVPLFAWHPGPSAGANMLDVAHAIQDLTAALPILWSVLSEAHKKLAVTRLARTADVLHRGSVDDPPFNIPFHCLLGALSTAALLPQLAKAPLWKATMDEYLSDGGPYGALPFIGPDGYYGEGLGYQNVNLMLSTRCLLLYQRTPCWSVPTGLDRRVEAGFDFAAGMVRPDGGTFLICDCMPRASHEHDKDMHEALHLGAAVFDRPDLKLAAGSLHNQPPAPHVPILMGPDGYERWRQMPSPQVDSRRHESVMFPNAGFINIKAGAGVTGSCHGLLKASVEHNHAHLDYLSMDIYALGRELIGDSGSIGYAPGRSAVSRSQLAHAMCRLAHVAPRGPRIMSRRNITIKRLETGADGRIQLALGEHRLTEDHVQRRALALLMPTERVEDALWLVWDRVDACGPGGTDEPEADHSPVHMRFVETNFPLHSPGKDASLDGTGDGAVLTGWSNHTPSDLLPEADGVTESKLTIGQALSIIEHGDSEANIQVSALAPTDPRAGLSLVAEEGFSSHMGYACPRPILSYRWRGLMPHECAYVLLPFMGQADQAPFTVDGWSLDRDRPGAFEAVIASGSRELARPVSVRANGLAGTDGHVVRVEMQVGDDRPMVLQFTL